MVGRKNLSLNISLDVHVAQDRVQHVSQGDFARRSLYLPLEQRRHKAVHAHYVRWTPGSSAAMVAKQKRMTTQNQKKVKEARTAHKDGRLSFRACHLTRN